MKYKREHKFKKVEKHRKAKPGYQVWRCNDCDSEIVFSARYDKRQVNRIMANRMLCLFNYMDNN